MLLYEFAMTTPLPLTNYMMNILNCFHPDRRIIQRVKQKSEMVLLLRTKKPPAVVNDNCIEEVLHHINLIPDIGTRNLITGGNRIMSLKCSIFRSKT